MDLVGQALVLAALGQPVFPCAADKRPTCPTGFKAATRDPGAVARLFARYPGVLIGIVCGPRSGIAVLDADTTKHPEAEVWLVANRYRLSGRVFQTRSGGSHLWFRWVPRVKCITGRPGRPCVGIDTRGEGGYVIWWGGDNVGRASPQGLAEWPEWLSQAIWPPPKPRNLRRLRRPMMRWQAQRVLEPILRKFAGTVQRERNSYFHWCARRAAEHVAAGHLSRAEAELQLTEASATTVPPMDPREVARTIEQAFKGGS